MIPNNKQQASEWVSEHILNGTSAQTDYTVTFMPVYDGKYTTKDKSKTDTTKIKLNAEKANNAKYSKTKLPRFSHLLRHSARIQGGLILQLPNPHEAPKSTKADYVNCSGPVYESVRDNSEADQGSAVSTHSSTAVVGDMAGLASRRRHTTDRHQAWAAVTACRWRRELSHARHRPLHVTLWSLLQRKSTTHSLAEPWQHHKLNLYQLVTWNWSRVKRLTWRILGLFRASLHSQSLHLRCFW